MFLVSFELSCLSLYDSWSALFAFPAPPEGGKPPLVSLYGIAGVLEFFAGLLLPVGFCTRSVAFLLSGRWLLLISRLMRQKDSGPRKTVASRPSFSASCFSMSRSRAEAH